MPANKNAMTRYALIDRMLANRNRAYSIQDMTDALAAALPESGQSPVTKRCVEKDLYYLEYESPFEVEIEEYYVNASDRNDRPYRKRCIRYSDPTFSIFKPKLSDDEKAVLSSALGTLGSFEGLENLEWLNDLSSRLKLDRHAPVIFFSRNIAANSTLIARLFTAIRMRHVITLTYHTFKNPVPRDVAVTPHIIKESNNRWFLIASACDNGRLLTFALDRIDDFSENYTAAYITAPDDLTERYEDIIGITYIEENPVEKIIFWTSETIRNYIETKPLHGSQKRLRGDQALHWARTFPTLPDGMFFQIECKRNYELTRELCAFGGGLRVLSPQTVVEDVKQRIADMSHIYSI